MQLMIVAALVGGGWRWWHGRGFGPRWVRLVACGALTGLICAPLGWGGAIPAALWVALWIPRQKQRERLPDMLLRWALPVALFSVVLTYFSFGWIPWANAYGDVLMVGIRLVLTAAAWLPTVPFLVAGPIMAVLVWVGTWWRVNDGSVWADSSALTEAAAGAVGFGALALAVNLVGGG